MANVNKDMRGNWMAEDSIQLDDTRHLEVLTMKRSSGMLVTTVKAVIKENNCSTYVPFQDYSDTLISSPLRCTSKNVATVHNEMMSFIEQVKAEALAFYAAKEPATV